MTNRIKVVKEAQDITTISQACNTYNLSRFRVKNNKSTHVDYGKVYKIIQLNNCTYNNNDYRLITEKSHFEAKSFQYYEFFSLSQFIEYLIDRGYEVYIVED